MTFDLPSQVVFHRDKARPLPLIGPYYSTGHVRKSPYRLSEKRIVDKIIYSKHKGYTITVMEAAIFRELCFARDMKRLFNGSYVLNVTRNVILKKSLFLSRRVGKC